MFFLATILVCLLGCTTVSCTSITCETCEWFLGKLQSVVLSNGSRDDVFFVMSEVCILFEFEDTTVCHGIVNMYVSEVMEIVADRFFAPRAVCELYYICPSSSPPPSFPPSSRGPPPRSAYRPRDPDVGYFVQLTDIHFDPEYAPQTNVFCGEPLCCRIEYGPGNASYWGMYECDLSRPLLDSLTAHLREHWLPYVDFVVHTGDVPPHDIWNQSAAVNLAHQAFLFDYLQTALPNTTLLPVIGNHGTYPVDQFYTRNRTGWLYDALTHIWAPFLPASTIPSLRQGGFYSVLVPPNLRVVSFNTMFYDLLNFWLVLNDTDPSGALTWLEGELAGARVRGERVLLAGHIPTSDYSALWGYGKRYVALLDEYVDVIMAAIYGHTHLDNVHVLLDLATNSTPVGMAYVAPSVTPFTQINPSFRVYEYDRKTGVLLDYQQWHVDLYRAIRDGNATWELYYSAKDSFGVADMSPQSWFDTLSRLWVDKDAFETAYEQHYTRKSITCDGKQCKANFICSTISSTHKQSVECSGREYSFKTIMEDFMNGLC